MAKKKTDSKDRGRLPELQLLLKERLLVLDGGMGTELQTKSLTARDFGGPEFEGCNENLVLTKKDAIFDVHKAYLQAGADIIETNTFGAVPHVLEEYGLAEKASEINRAAVELALKAAKKASEPKRPRFVAGAMGPGTKTISVTGGITFDEVRRSARAWALDLVDAGSDLLLVETQQDTLNLKATLAGIDDCFKSLDRRVPVMVSVSIESTGTMLGGQNVEALYASLAHRDLLALGLNCATGPDFMTDHIRTLAEVSRFPVICYPNAGLPDENGRYSESPASLAKKIERFCSQGWLNLVGGCCGTTPAHIRLIAAMAMGVKPRQPGRKTSSVVAGLEALTVTEKNRPILVGERANILGSRIFKELITKGDYEAASEIGRKQVRSGAQILNVCLSNPERDELTDMKALLGQLTKKVRVPLMIDSTNPDVAEAALALAQGKCIINSVNLEDGGERLARIVPVLKAHGAAVVAGCIDEDKDNGMAVTAERKLSVAQRLHATLTKGHGLAQEDLYFDPLVFPAASGDKNYQGSAKQTIDGVRLIKKLLPRCKTILGISNVSFGLPPAGREVLNAVFLYHCVQAGLDLAIVNTEKLARYSALPEEDRRLAENVLFWDGTGEDPAQAFAARYKTAPAGAAASAPSRDLPAEERIAACVVAGTKEGLLHALDELLPSMPPLKIVNGPLMKGMAEVGRLFGANELIVAEVLQSAEVMKAAVTHLEPHMDASDASSRGKIVLATVKGDVHEIGKNLVHIILKNNGFEVIDLGIKIPPETLIEAVRKHAPDAVGLSGLLVKSAEQMSVTAEDLAHAGIDTPIIVGGAALTPKFTTTKIAPRYKGPVLYAATAMKGLEIMISLAAGSGGPPAAAATSAAGTAAASPRTGSGGSVPASTERKTIQGGPIPVDDIPVPPDLDLHKVEVADVRDIFNYINPDMLYGKHLGFRQFERAFNGGVPKALELGRRVGALQEELASAGLMKPAGVYRFYAAQSDEDSINLYGSAEGGEPIETFTFPRQAAGEGLCLSDYVAARASGKMDYVALFAVTCGHGIVKLSEDSKAAGDYLRSHALQALGIESAEAFAELLHEKLRGLWGFADPAELTLRQKFQARYRGLRVSFGYPACPEIEDQKKLFALLDPSANAGITLTEGCMMSPEASVSALALHHPAAKYFSAKAAAETAVEPA